MKKRCSSIIFLTLSVLMILGGIVLQSEQRELSSKMIRLHVVGASDAPEDQLVKLHVRDAVLQTVQPMLRDCDDAHGRLSQSLDEIAEAAQAALHEQGVQTQVRVRLGKELFPTREYDTFSLPAGVYDSLRVSIGEAAGKNWWCVVFPSICMTASMDELELAASAAGFTEQELGLITKSNEGYVLKFKSLELLQKVKNFLTGT